MDSLFRISLYHVINYNIRYSLNNVIPKRLVYILESFKKLEFPEEFYEQNIDDIYYEKGVIYIPENCPYSFSCMATVVKTHTVFFAFKKISERTFEKQMVFYSKKDMDFFSKKNKRITNKWVYISNEEFPLFNRRNILVDKTLC